MAKRPSPTKPATSSSSSQASTPPAAAPVDRGVGADGRPAVVAKVFVNAVTSGVHPALEAIPLHEVVLFKRKLSQLGNSCKLDGDWPKRTDRTVQVSARELRSEYMRLREKYTYTPEGKGESDKIDLMVDVYGPPHQGRLRAIMVKIDEAWRQLVADTLTTKKGIRRPTAQELDALAALADPEQDFIDPDDEAGNDGEDEDGEEDGETVTPARALAH